MTTPVLPRLVLGIETSCDETAAAVVEAGRIVRSNVVASQVALHAPYGGVFPEVASRQHVRDVLPVVRRALADASVSLSEVDGIAVTRGPGLSGALLVGLNAAKGLAMAADKPIVGVNHLGGHLASHWLHTDGMVLTPERVAAAGGIEAVPEPPLPHLALVVSGGHTDLALVNALDRVIRLGGTMDDAAGEAFDKAARMLGLGYPGGPAIERAAEGGDAARFALPVSRTSEPFDFSFSGLKSALRRTIERLGGDPDAPIGWASDGNPGGASASGSTPPGGGSAGLSEPHGLPLRDLTASFQHAVVAALIDRLTRAADGFPEARALCISGGVSANRVLRSALAEWGAERGLAVWWPPLELCTDNGAMIAAAGARLLAAGRDDGAALDLTLGLSIDSP